MKIGWFFLFCFSLLYYNIWDRYCHYPQLYIVYTDCYGILPFEQCSRYFSKLNFYFNDHFYAYANKHVIPYPDFRHSDILFVNGIDPNPGPPVNRICIICKRAIRANQRFMSCKFCGCFTHCSNNSKSKYNCAKFTDGLWSCQFCLFNTLPFSKRDKIDSESNTHVLTESASIVDNHVQNLTVARGLRMGFLNICHLPPKLDFLKVFGVSNIFDILIVGET